MGPSLLGFKNQYIRTGAHTQTCWSYRLHWLLSPSSYSAAIESLDIPRILSQQGGEAVYPLPRIKTLEVHSKLNLAALLFIVKCAHLHNIYLSLPQMSKKCIFWKFNLSYRIWQVETMWKIGPHTLGKEGNNCLQFCKVQEDLQVKIKSLWYLCIYFGLFS